MNNALTISGLTKTYKDFVLDNVSFSVPSGSIVGLIGENGAGKSTTINAALGLIHKEAGHVSVLGKDELDNETKEQIGVVFDGSNYPEILSPKKINQIMKNIYGSWDEQAYFRLLKQFSLPLDKQIKQFSKGMKMKLAIAGAMCHGAKLLVLDEATSGLDPVVRNEILDILLDFVQDEGNSVLMSSHIISDLEKVCDFITFIKDGRIVFSAEKELLTGDYGILRCSNSDFEKVDKSAVVSYNQNSFSTDALVYRNKVNGDFIIDKANVEDIMLYYMKEGE